MADDEGGDWAYQQPEAGGAYSPDTQDVDTGYAAEAYAVAQTGGGEPAEGRSGLIQVQFQAPIAGHAYSDAEIAALLQAGLPDSVASLVEGAPTADGGDANA